MLNEHGLERKLDAAMAGNADALDALLASVLDDSRLRSRIDARISPPYRLDISADDVLQVTCLEVYLRIGQFENRGYAAFWGWVATIAENRLADAIRALQRDKRPPVQFRKANGGASDSSFSTFGGISLSTPSRAASREEARAILERAVEALPRDYQIVVRRLDIEEKAVADVAEELGRSRGAVHMLRDRAHARLVEILLPQGSVIEVGSFR